MESAHPEPADLIAGEALDPVPHLAGRLVGEGNGQDLVGEDAALLQQPRDPVSQDPGLARARPGDDEDRSLRGLDSPNLVVVEPADEPGTIGTGHLIGHGLPPQTSVLAC